MSGFKALRRGALAALPPALPLLLAGAAQAPPQAPPCFDTREIRNTVRPSPREIVLRTIDNRYFRIVTKNSCRSGSLPDPLVFKTGGGPGRICRPVDLTLSSGLQPNVACLVDSIALLTPAEVEALPPKSRP